MTRRYSRRSILRATTAAAIGAAGIGVATSSPTVARETQSIPLVAGWNTYAWCGPEVPVAQALADLPLRFAYSWDVVNQRYLGYAPGTPINTIGRLQHGQPLWMRLSADADWTQPTFRGPLPAAQQLPIGWSFIGWSGEHQPVWVAFSEDAFGPVAEALRWSPEVGDWLSYVPGESAQQLFAVLHPGDAVWVRMRLPGATWNPVVGVVPSDEANQVVAGQATYYHPSLAGGPMYCSGHAYDPQDPTIASSVSWSCGTRLRVWRDDRSVEVIVQDTGALAQNQVDLSEAAFRQLGDLAEGRLNVLIEVLSGA